MTVKIRIPSVKGDSMQELELQEAKETVDELLEKRWIVAVGGKAVQDSKALEDGAEVLTFPPIVGG